MVARADIESGSLSAHAARAEARSPTADALEVLERAIGPEFGLEDEVRAAVATTCARVRAVLARGPFEIAIAGDRSANALLDAWIARSIFGSTDSLGGGPPITIAYGARSVCRARDASGAVEELSLDLPWARPPSVHAARGGWLARLARLFRRVLGSLFGRGAPELPAPLVDEGAARVRSVFVDAGGSAPFVDARIELPIPELRASLVIHDVRGAAGRDTAAASAFARERADVCLVVLDRDGDPRAHDAARAFVAGVTAMGPRILAATAMPRAVAARALGVEAARVVCVAESVDLAELEERAAAERALFVRALLAAAQRLVQSSLETDLAREDELERASLERLAALGVPSRRRRRDETRHKVDGATAGQAIRALQSVLSLFESEFVPLREECSRRVAAATTLAELRASVAEAGAALGALKAKLVAHAERFVADAMARLGPPLLDDLERRAAAFACELVQFPSPTPPAFPPLPAIRLEDRLVAGATLAGAESLRADVGFLDTYVRRFERVKARCLARLDAELEAIAEAVHVEVLGSEPRVARSLHDGLEAWVEAAADALGRWHAHTLETERHARERVRLARTASARALLGELAASAVALGGSAASPRK